MQLKASNESDMDAMYTSRSVGVALSLILHRHIFGMTVGCWLWPCLFICSTLYVQILSQVVALRVELLASLSCVFVDQTETREAACSEKLLSFANDIRCI